MDEEAIAEITAGVPAGAAVVARVHRPASTTIHLRLRWTFVEPNNNNCRWTSKDHAHEMCCFFVAIKDLIRRGKSTEGTQLYPTRSLSTSREE